MIYERFALLVNIYYHLVPYKGLICPQRKLKSRRSRTN